MIGQPLQETAISERADGLCEYKRVDIGDYAYQIYGRKLDRNGNPFDDNWYPISDAEMLHLNTLTDVMAVLCPHQK